MSDFINEHWEKQASIYGLSHEASWGDVYALQLEIETISNYVERDMDILDVGCANGFSTIQHLSKNPHSLTGVDFSPKMVEFAREREETKKYPQIHFEVGDVRDLPFEEQFDLVYTTRVLINLPSWNEQIQGVKECLRVCRHGGKVILSEAFWEPLMLLNAMRTLNQLTPLQEHDFNRYIKKHKLEKFLSENSLPYEINEFSSVYYLGSRLLRELVTDTDEYPGYSNPVNEAFFELEKVYSGGGFGIQQAYIISKP